jgi:hypothetical protein
VIIAARAEPGVVQVAEHVLAGTDLGDHAAGGELDGGCGAGADHLCGDPQVGEAVHRGGEPGVLVLRGALGSVPTGAGMTWVREDATGTRRSLWAASARSPRHLWRRSRSTGATVDLDHDLAPVRFITDRVGEGIDRRELVHADPKPGGLGEPADPRPLVRAGQIR